MDCGARLNREVNQLCIVGTGLLGASLGLGLRAAGFSGTIVGVGRRQSTVDRAKQLGCIDHATTDLAGAASKSQLAVLATPLGTFRTLFQRLAECDHQSLIITDVGSTKQLVCGLAHTTLPDPSRFVGSHPMAGSEQQGPESARTDLFVSNKCIVTPEPQTGPEALSLVRTFWTTLGMKLVEMSPAEHDRKAACISHMPHAAAVMLVSLAAREQALDVAASGFRDTTRVASGDPTVWTDIFMSNRQDLITAIDAFAVAMQRLRAMLACDDTPGLREELRCGKALRDEWEHKREANR